MTTAPVKTMFMRAGAALIASAALLGMLSACSPAEPEPTPTKTALFASEEEAFAAAEETYRAYLDAYNAIDLQDPSTFEATRQFTGGKFGDEERRTLSEFHAEGYTRTGETLIIAFRGDSYDGTKVTARTCNDVSATDIRDADGRSIVSSDRRDVYALNLTFTRDDDSLRLSDAIAVEDSACTS